MSNRTIKTCSIDGCASKVHIRGWCKKHYKRWYRHGDPLKTINYHEPEEAFKNQVIPKGTCLVWAGYKNDKGYGQLVRDGVTLYAHRYAWERANGQIPDGMLIDHICHTPLCVKVSHLRLATVSENVSYQSGASSASTSGIKNVYRKGNLWQVQIQKDGALHNFGTYRTVKEAAVVAQQARIEIHGEFATIDLERTA